MASAKIASGLAELRRPTSDLTTHPDNPRRGDVGAIAESLRRFGQVRPIIVQADGTILAGNHTFRAATEELGWEEIAAVTVDLPEDEARAFLLADNRTSDLGTYDDQVLAGLLENLLDAGQLTGTGYDPDGVEDLLAQIGQVAETEAEEFTGDYAESPEDTAHRWNVPDGESRRAVAPMREVVLMFPSEKFDEFAALVKGLKAAYETASTVETVDRAIREAAERHGVTAAPAPSS